MIFLTLPLTRQKTKKRSKKVAEKLSLLALVLNCHKLLLLPLVVRP